MNDITKVKTYKGIEIFYHLDNGLLSAKDSKTGEQFNGKYVFEIEREIDKPVWTPCQKTGFIVSGYFNRELSFVIASKENSKDKTPYWIVKKSTDSQYENGKHIDEDTVVYPDVPENNKIYEQVSSIQKEIQELEQKQRNIINGLVK